MWRNHAILDMATPSNAKSILLSRLRLARGFPGQFIKRRIVALSPIFIFGQVYFVAVIVSDADAVLIAYTLAIDASGHRLERIQAMQAFSERIGPKLVPTSGPRDETEQ